MPRRRRCAAAARPTGPAPTIATGRSTRGLVPRPRRAGAASASRSATAAAACSDRPRSRSSRSGAPAYGRGRGAAAGPPWRTARSRWPGRRGCNRRVTQTWLAPSWLRHIDGFRCIDGGTVAQIRAGINFLRYPCSHDRPSRSSSAAPHSPSPRSPTRKPAKLETVFKALADRHRVKILNRLLAAGRRGGLRMRLRGDARPQAADRQLPPQAAARRRHRRAREARLLTPTSPSRRVHSRACATSSSSSVPSPWPHDRNDALLGGNPKPRAAQDFVNGRAAPYPRAARTSCSRRSSTGTEPPPDGARASISRLPPARSAIGRAVAPGGRVASVSPCIGTTPIPAATKAWTAGRSSSS